MTSYARKSLTFESDKLPALSGMARQMQRYLNNSGKNEYLAGLWRGNLLSDLCWERVKYTKHSYDPDSRIAYRAPSWFWCAVNDLVLHTRFMKPDSSNHLDFARIIEANCSPKDNDPTGAVATGHLTIEGLMIKVSLKYKRRDSGQYPKHVFEYSITDLLHIEDGPSITRDYDYSTKGPGHVPDRSEVHCLMLARRRDEPFVPVLHADDEAPVFRRIGCISFWSFNNAEHRYFDGASRKTVTIV